MEKNQPWNQMGQGYRPGYFQQRPFNRSQPQGSGPGQPLGTGQPMSPGQGQSIGHGQSIGQTPDLTQPMEWLGGLSREDKLEARRLQLQANFSFEGFQVVRREFMSHVFDPAMTIRGTSITFNNACISKLENATYIHFLINPNLMMLLIRAVDEGTRDAIRWCVVKGDKRKSRAISCRLFTEKLYEMMGWNSQYRYKMQGMKIRYEGEEMYLFDLNAVECFLPQHRDPKTGKLSRAQAVLPEEWQGQFGMGVEEHRASTQVDLENGFTELGRESAPDAQDAPDTKGASAEQPSEEYSQQPMDSTEENHTADDSGEVNG